MSDGSQAPQRKRRTLVRALIAVVGVLIAGAGAVAFQSWRLRQPVNPLTADGKPNVVVMDFSKPVSVNAPPPGWMHRTFWTRPAMQVSFVTKDGIPALRCETDGSGSIFGRWTDIDLEHYPLLSWRWFVEVPIASDRDEASRAGDDHPVRFFAAFADSEGRAHHAEIIWSNGRFKRGDWKIIGAFVHYVADGGDGNIGQWREQTADLAAIYRKASGRNDKARLTQLAVFCDSDDTGGHSVAYVGGPVTMGK
jgi:hypothetical protein